MRFIALIVFSILWHLVGGAAQAQPYPSKPIVIISPFATGGTSDFVGRIVAQKLGENLGWRVVIESKPGANGQIGTDFVAKSAPDGYTLCLGPTSTHGINPSIFKNLPYDVLRDFVGITMLGSNASVLGVNPAVPAANLKEFFAFAKANPRKLAFSSPGTGTAVHIAGELINSAAGIDLLHVPYKGSGPAIAAVLSGDVQVLIDNITSAAPNIKAGRIRPLAVTSLQRQAILPDVPTLDESGLKNFEMLAWFSLFAPAATPKSVVQKLNQEVVKVLMLPDIREQMLARGIEPRPMSLEQFAAAWRSDVQKFARIVKDAGISVEQ